MKVMNKLALCLLFGLALGGCMRPQASPAELLNKSLHAFHGHLIFKRFDAAAAYVPVATREDFLAYYEDQNEDLKITEYEINRIEMNEEETVAKTEITVSWYRMPSSTIQKTKMIEDWEYTRATGRWEVLEQREKDAPNEE